jgi:hypothetical protein
MWEVSREAKAPLLKKGGVGVVVFRAKQFQYALPSSTAKENSPK